MTRIIVRDEYGHQKASVLTGHNDPEFIRDEIADSFKGGAFANFGHHGDTITIDAHPYDNPHHHPYLERLSSASTTPDEREQEISTVTVYRITSRDFMLELDEIECCDYREGDGQSHLREFILSCLALNESGEDMAPGVRHRTYEVTRAGRDLIVVKETVSLNL